MDSGHSSMSYDHVKRPRPSSALGERIPKQNSQKEALAISGVSGVAYARITKRLKEFPER